MSDTHAPTPPTPAPAPEATAPAAPPKDPKILNLEAEVARLNHLLQYEKARGRLMEAIHNKQIAGMERVLSDIREKLAEHQKREANDLGAQADLMLGDVERARKASEASKPVEVPHGA